MYCRTHEVEFKKREDVSFKVNPNQYQMWTDINQTNIKNHIWSDIMELVNSVDWHIPSANKIEVNSQIAAHEVTLI